MQIKTYLPAEVAKLFDRIATKLDLSRYELANLAIQEYITKDSQSLKETAMKQRPELPRNPKIQFTAARQPPSRASVNFKMPSEQAETSAKNTSTKSYDKHATLKQLLTPSLSAQSTPNKPNNSSKKNSQPSNNPTKNRSGE